jgi:hypothetical protein
MAKLIANLVNETMTAAQIAQFQRGIQMAMDALPKKPILSNEDYAKIPKKGAARRQWANQMLEVAKAFPEIKCWKLQKRFPNLCQTRLK